MAEVLVWSERDEPNSPTWNDCSYSAALMALIAAGYQDFPEGIYTVAEREALERSDSRADEEGANELNLDEAVMNRYKVKLHSTTKALAELIQIPGLAIIVAGTPANWPKGHNLRRWLPNFAGGHRVCIITSGGPVVKWLDPLAPWKYKGDEVEISEVLKFAYASPQYLRYLMVDELAKVKLMKTDRPVGVVAYGPPIATARLRVGCQFLSPGNTEVQYGPYSFEVPVNVYSEELDLRDDLGRLVDCDNDYPPKGRRGRVRVVFGENWAGFAYALADDLVDITPLPIISNEALDRARTEGISLGRKGEYDRVTAGASAIRKLVTDPVTKKRSYKIFITFPPAPVG